MSSEKSELARLCRPSLTGRAPLGSVASRFAADCALLRAAPISPISSAYEELRQYEHVSGNPPIGGIIVEAILCNVPLLWDTAALRMACRQPRSISGLVEEILKWAKQVLKRVWLAKSSGLICRSSSGASHLVATSMAGILEFVKAAASVRVSPSRPRTPALRYASTSRSAPSRHRVGTARQTYPKSEEAREWYPCL